MGDVGVNVGYGWGSQKGNTGVQYYGDMPNWMYWNDYTPMDQLLLRSMAGGNNQGALADMIMGGQGFGRSRRFGQYAQYPSGNPPPTTSVPGGQTGNQAPPPPAGGPNKAFVGGAAGGEDPNNMASELPSNEPDWTNINDPKYRPGTTHYGSWNNDPDYDLFNPANGGPGGSASGGEGGSGAFGGNSPLPPGTTGGDASNRITDYGPAGNPNYNMWDQEPDQNAGLLGEILNYGNPNEIDERLLKDLGWQASGDLMDLESQEKGLWDKFGKQNQNEKAVDDTANWFRGGDLSSLEQEAKWGYKNYGDATDLENEVGDAWRGVAGPGEYDPLRGKTLTEMVGSKGYSPTERSAMMGSSLLPIQQALEAQKLEGDARQAATGNAAGRWGASNAMSLAAAGKAADAGRAIETGSAEQARTDRLQGLSGLGGLQGQIDARKVQGASGLQNLSGQQRAAGLASIQGQHGIAQDQRQNQLAGMSTLMQSNQQQRDAQATAAQGIGGLGQRQRANTQWGLGALSGQNDAMKNDKLTGIGLRKDLYDTAADQEARDLDRAAQIGSLVRGGTSGGSSSGGNVGVSV